jgi:PEP-CTERM motif
MKNIIKSVALCATTASLLTSAAHAANSFYQAGDLVLAFQQEGGSQTAYINLGDSAAFRGAAAGAQDGVNQINYLNINTTMTTAFGANWASQTNLYGSVSANWGISSTSNTLQNGDPQQTLYVSRSRDAVGTVGTPESIAWTTGTGGGHTVGSSGINNQNSILENLYTTPQAVSPNSVSRIDENQPFAFPGIQGLAFGTFDGGVQQVGTAGAFGTFAETGEVEFALDIYRILGKTTAPGQVGGTLRNGTYEGTFTINSGGDVSFIAQAVPEPSALGLLGLGMGGLVLRRRRSINA